MAAMLLDLLSAKDRIQGCVLPIDYVAAESAFEHEIDTSLTQSLLTSQTLSKVLHFAAVRRLSKSLSLEVQMSYGVRLSLPGTCT